ncbi:acyl-transferase [Mediterranea sp. An20]|uniref:acyltransferase n=1 Tax=Mediterranea sp. An20 TaxID=1965586 RepID=UPI000B395196|nr:acyltransferase [Mediterranea sp. An20]OUP10678.1 acyl-transferase [Mediterranea sp. An20]
MKKQIVWLDAVRLFAFFFLLCCHAADPFYATATYANADVGGPVDPAMLTWGERWMAFVRPCVPLFVMITGALMFPVRQSMGAFYKKRILRVLWPFLIWSVLYYLFPWITGLLGLDKSIVYTCFIWAESDSQSFQSSLANILRIPYTFSFIAQHMWYIYMLIGLYLYMPIFSAWVERATKRQMQVVLGLWGLSTFLPYFHQFVSTYAFGTCTWNSFGLFYYFAGFNGYLLLGHYLRYHVNWSWSRTWPVALVLLVAGFLVTYLGYGYIMSLPDKTPEMIELFWTYNTINVACMSAAWFLLLKHVSLPAESKAGRMLANLTFCGFGIYMVHYFFVGLCYQIIQTFALPVCLRIPASALLIFAFSWILVSVVKKAMGRRAVYLMG